jgi:hypothetical protein
LQNPWSGLIWCSCKFGACNITNYMDLLWTIEIHTYMPRTRWFEGLKLFLVIYFDNHKLIDIDYNMGWCFLIVNCKFVKNPFGDKHKLLHPHLWQNHVSPSVGNVHWLAPDFQRVIKQQCDGEVSSPKRALIGRQNHGS